MDLPINISDRGFYLGFTTHVTITAKLLVAALILWAIVFPKDSSTFLSSINSTTLDSFGFWYVYAMAFFVISCLALATWPVSGRLKLGLRDDKPEFSNFSWFSMRFGSALALALALALAC
jgi:choline/glycine/proline betaine transport protein